MNRALKYVLLGAAAALLLTVLVVLVLTRSEFGAERFRRFAVDWVAEQVHGTVRVGRVTSGGLLGGLMLHDVEIIDERQRPFFAADSVAFAYDWRTLLGGTIVLHPVTLHQPQLVIERLPGDTAWNYEYIFRDTTPSLLPRTRRLIAFHDVRIASGRAWVRLDFDEKPPFEPADTARLILEAAPGGLQRVFRFEDVAGELTRVVWESPEETGKLFQIADISGRGYVYQRPFDLREARGTVVLRDSVTSFEVPHFRLPSSNGSMFGRVIAASDENVYDIKIGARSFVFDDLKWIYPRLPDEGGGSLDLRIQTLPDGILWDFTEMSLRAPGTNLAGAVGMVIGESAYFTRVNLRASPFDLEVVEAILPGALPVRGLMVGTVVIEGPLS